MPATILDGVALADTLRHDVRRRAEALRAAGHPVRLAAVLTGDGPAGRIYADRQAASCRDAGIDYDLYGLPETATPGEIGRAVDRLNREPGVTGVMLHAPLPAGVDPTALQYRIDPAKDVEGVNPANIGHVVYGRTRVAPCTAAACLELIAASGVDLVGAEACVVGASEIAGKPAALLLMQRRATVTVCHRDTRDLSAHTRRADVLVVAVGRPNLIRPEQVKPGACVIDVGINRVTTYDGQKRTVGDVDFDAVREVAGHLTPVPGGVGPVTVAMLLRNTVSAAERLAGFSA